MTHPELVRALAKPGQSILNDLTPESAHLWHMATGYAGEVMELFEQVVVKGAGDEGNILEEAGDILFYEEGGRQAAGITDEQWVGYLITLSHLTEPSCDMGKAMGIMVARAGDVLDAGKKCAVYKSALNAERFGHALAASHLRLVDVLHGYGMTTGQARQHNIDKLTVRYGRTYSNEAAQLRKDKE